MAFTPRCWSGTGKCSFRGVAAVPRAVRVASAAVEVRAELQQARVPQQALQDWALRVCLQESPVRRGHQGLGLGPAVQRWWPQALWLPAWASV